MYERCLWLATRPSSPARSLRETAGLPGGERGPILRANRTSDPGLSRAFAGGHPSRCRGRRSSMLRASLRFLVFVCLLFVAARPAAAQSTYGAVVGVVTDSTKAITPGATVTLREVQTNVVRTGTSGADGNYEFLNLTQGRYQVTVEMSGFSRITTEPFPVGARQTVRIDMELKTAALQEEVTVSGAAPLINTENPTISGSKTNRELQQL